MNSLKHTEETMIDNDTDDSKAENQMDEINLAVEEDNADVKIEMTTTDNKIEETNIAVEEGIKDTKNESATTDNKVEETKIAIEEEKEDKKNEVATTDNKVEETKIAIEEDGKDAKNAVAEKPKSKFNTWKCWLPVALVVLVLVIGIGVSIPFALGVFSPSTTTETPPTTLPTEYLPNTPTEEKVKFIFDPDGFYWNSGCSFLGSDIIIHNDISSIKDCASLCSDTIDCDNMNYQQYQQQCQLKGYSKTEAEPVKSLFQCAYIVNGKTDADFKTVPGGSVAD